MKKQKIIIILAVLILSWSAVIYSRTRGSGCPFCANKIKSPKKNKEI